eukprot:15467485-Heterocapsa_arctica.AAC.1
MMGIIHRAWYTSHHTDPVAWDRKQMADDLTTSTYPPFVSAITDWANQLDTQQAASEALTTVIIDPYWKLLNEGLHCIALRYYHHPSTTSSE